MAAPITTVTALLPLPPLPDPLFEKTYTLGWPGIAVGFDTFRLPSSLQDNPEFSCTIEKSSGASLTGWIMLNGRRLASRDFLRGNETTLTIPCALKRNNTIGVLLMGRRGASVSIRISSQNNPAPTAELAVSPRRHQLS